MLTIRSIQSARANLAELPFPFGTICEGAMVATPILLALLVLPLIQWKFDGHEVSYDEMWHSGAILVYGSFLLLGGIGSWGLAFRKGRARWAIVALPLAPIALAFSFHGSNLIDRLLTPTNIAICSVWALIFYWLLFRSASIGRYISHAR